VLKSVVVVQKRLLGIERRVEVRELHFACVFVTKLWKTSQACECVEGIPPDEQIGSGAIALGGIGPDLPHGMQKANFGDTIIGRREPRVGPVYVREQALVFVRPGELKATAVVLSLHRPT
jgi:hypothetical protein